MPKRMVPRENKLRDRSAEEENFGERFGNNYGFAREGEHVEEFGPRTEESDYVDRYRRPQYTELDLTTTGPYRGKGPRGYRRSDERIKDDIYERLTRHGGIDARSINLEVHDGEVILKGRVNNRQAKRMAEDVVLGVSGVTDIRNELRLR